jgi:hypothetical protein
MITYIMMVQREWPFIQFTQVGVGSVSLSLDESIQCMLVLLFPYHGALVFFVLSLG